VPGGSDATTAAAAAGWGRGEASYRLATAKAGTAGSGVAVIVITVITGRSSKTVISPPVTALCGIETIAAAIQLTGISIGCRAVDPVVAVRNPCSKAVAVAGAVESAQVGVYVVIIRASLHDDDTPAIVGVIEVRVVAGIPEEIAVPSEIGIHETHTEAIGKSVSVHGISISETHAVIRADRGGIIVGIVCVVVVEIRPAGLVLRFHADVVVAGRCAVIITIVGRTCVIIIPCVPIVGCCYHTAGRTGRVIYIIRCLGGFPGGRATGEQDKANGQEGNYLFHGESI